MDRKLSTKQMTTIILKKIFFSQNLDNLKLQKIKEKGFVNIYKYFGKKNNLIWPRGLPLSKLDNISKLSKKLILI